ncbi:hypothetical protein Lpl7_0146 [Lacticaseibacillus paracasei subsp. tolerans Lpl7]|nr:hypothetical protein Lpl7_0146 [Lacticaseibacillus paracasei subsp. tolerans Lpl7]
MTAQPQPLINILIFGDKCQIISHSRNCLRRTDFASFDTRN